jgi:hypothetical protein
MGSAASSVVTVMKQGELDRAHVFAVQVSNATTSACPQPHPRSSSPQLVRRRPLGSARVDIRGRTWFQVKKKNANEVMLRKEAANEMVEALDPAT